LFAERPSVASMPSAAGRREEFVPLEPKSFDALGIPQVLVENLVLKYLLNVGIATGRRAAEQLKLRVIHLAELLGGMKQEQLVALRRSSGVNDYEFELTAPGGERARRLYELGTYFGAAPVSLQEYTRSMLAQSPRRDRPTAEGLRRALGELLVDRTTF